MGGLEVRKSTVKTSLNPPIHIKNYEYVNPATPKRNPLQKSTTSTINVDEGNRSDNSFTTIAATKRRSNDKYLEPLKVKGRTPTISNKTSKNDIQQVLAEKSLNKGYFGVGDNKYSKGTMGPILRGNLKKPSTKKLTNEIVLGGGASNNFNIGGSTQIYVNQIVVDNNAHIMKGSSTISPAISSNEVSKKPSQNIQLKVVSDDRKFSIMDIPGSIVNMHSKFILNFR
jgi:hypothetical protein